MKPLFALGHTVATPGALEVLSQVGQSPAEMIRRHVLGDWSDLSQEDRESNFAAVLSGGRIVSAYPLRKDIRIWVVTEADRSTTTVLLPDEY